MNDLFNLMDGGYGSQMFTICSCLLQLNRHPSTKAKLIRELEVSGIKNEVLNGSCFSDESTRGLLHKYVSIKLNHLYSCEYLTNVIKECMRVDPTTYATSAYVTIDKVQICGVEVPKDTRLFLDIGKYLNKLMK